MLIRVSLLLLSVGVYASHAYSTTASPASTTEDELFGQLDFIFPGSFTSKFPQESEFFTMKIFVYLFFSLFAKYFGEHQPITFWSKFNHNDFNRVAIDAAFYEYLTRFADRKMKNRIFDPLGSSTRFPEIIVVVDRIGDYLDSLSAAEASVEKSEIRLQDTKTKYHKHRNTKVSAQTPVFGIAGKDFPNYYDIPKTSFTCANKLVPGIYADTETGCQVFHTCWPRRIDSYLCPIGTTFNQALLTCDFWNDTDCSSAPLHFDQPIRPPFAMGKTPKNPEPTPTTDDGTETTSESSSASTPELDIPEYDGTCQSLLCKQLQLNMKFQPVKCKVTELKRSSTPDGFTKHYVERFDKLMTKILSENFREVFEFLTKASELGSRLPRAAVRPEPKVEKQTQKLDSKVTKETTESPSKEDIDTTTEEQIYSSTTELPSDNEDKLPQRINSRFAKEFKSTSNGKVTYGRTVRRSTLLKPSKPSEDAIKQVFDAVSTSIELGGKLLNDGLLPLVEQIVLDSRRKKSA